MGAVTVRVRLALARVPLRARLPLLGASAAFLLAAWPVMTLLGDDLARRIRDQEKSFAGSVYWVKVTMASDDGEEGSGHCSGPALTYEGRTILVVPDIPEHLKEARILLPDGQEIEAEVLAHDDDIGLMFLVPAQAKEAPAPTLKGIPVGKPVKPGLGDPLLLIDRRSHTVPDETTCRFVRVTCVLKSPETIYFYSDIAEQQMGGLVVTAEGEAVGIVGIFRDRNENGDETKGVGLLPMEKVLSSVSAVRRPEPEAKPPDTP